jgi:GntR family transcriptional regulator
MPQVRNKPAKNTFNLDAPLYARITNELRQRITTGQYPIGCLLPTEAELSEEFSTSRHTVREALRRLIEQGMVRSRQGAGTSVISVESNARYVQSFQSISDLFQNSIDTHFVIHRIEPVVLDVETLARLEAKPKQKWLHVAGVRWTKPGGTPICYIDSYVPNEYAEIVAEFPKQERAPFYSVLEERTGSTIDHVYQEIRAARMPREVANCFGLEEGSLSLQLLRRYVTRNGTLIASFNWHRGDQFTYRMQIDRRQSNEV